MVSLSDKQVPGIIGRLRLYFPEVDRVADAKKPLALQVTEGDISKGTGKSPNNCAFAVACRRLYGVDGVAFFTSMAYVVKGDMATRYMLPPSVRSEIKIFDRGGQFMPGDYQLSAVTEGNRMDRPKAKGPNSRRGKGGPKGKPKFIVKHHTVGLRMLTPLTGV